MLTKAKEVAEIIGQKYQAEVTEVRQGDLTKVGIVIGSGETRPIFYICNYMMEESTNEEIADIIMEHYEDLDELEFDKERFFDWDEAQEHLILCVRPKTANQDDVSVMMFNTDLELYVRYTVKESGYDGSIVIKYEHLKMWDIDKHTLFDKAVENTKSRFSVMNINDILLQRMSGRDLKMEPFDTAIEELTIGDEMPIMLVLSAIDNHYGASVMFYPSILERVAEKLKGDFYILPSSVHEIICIPTYDVEGDKLHDMIKEINDSMLEENERLSDYPFIYRRGTRLVEQL